VLGTTELSNDAVGKTIVLTVVAQSVVHKTIVPLTI
jgi:hypothetical protein